MFDLFGGKIPRFWWSNQADSDGFGSEIAGWPQVELAFRYRKISGWILQGGAPPSYKLVYKPINYRYITYKP